MTKANYIKSAIATTVTAAYLALTPQVQAQTKYSKLESITQSQSEVIQKGLQAPIPTGQDGDYSLFKMPFSSALKSAVENTENPSVYTISNNSYVEFNKDSTSLILGVHKSDLGEKIGVGFKKNSKMSPCSPNGPGASSNSLPFDYLTISEQIVNAPSRQRDTIINRVNEYNIVLEDNSVTNINFIDSRKSLEKKDRLFRSSLEGNLSTDKSLSGTFAAQVNLGSGISLGPYVTLSNGENKNTISENVSIVTPINKQLSTRTSGTSSQTISTGVNYEVGLRTSLDSKNKRTSLNFDLGFENSFRKTSEKTEKGIDEMLMLGESIDSKDYCYTTGEKESSDAWSPAIGASMQFFPSRNSGFFLTGGIKHTLNGVNKGTTGKVGIGFKIGRGRKGRK